MAVPGTPRDSSRVLDTLLNQDGGVRPEMVNTDNASYSDMVCGVFKMLGHRFAPCFRDLAGQRFRRAGLPSAACTGKSTSATPRPGSYGRLEALARTRCSSRRSRPDGSTSSSTPSPHLTTSPRT
ncbi:Tn3 family transposase [Streptomyces sp. KMM 9044]|nr:transposase [Streptomyces sp. KMM 9044]WAX81395.1 Tn3 family transposase [Streptomyces sp. KMM 9044]